MQMRSLRWVALVLVAFAFGYAGVRFGQALRSRSAAPVAETSPFPFRPGDVFPSVALADSLGNNVSSDSLVAGHGAVVLLLDPNCDGCTDMSIRWEHALAEGFFDPSRVFGVSRAPVDANRAYRAANHLSFPIYQDVADAFLQQHKVLSYPLEIVVGQSGTIRSLSDNSKTPVDGEEIRLLLTE
jgi:peroxiredoxin